MKFGYVELCLIKYLLLKADNECGSINLQEQLPLMHEESGGNDKFSSHAERVYRGALMSLLDKFEIKDLRY